MKECLKEIAITLGFTAMVIIISVVLTKHMRSYDSYTLTGKVVSETMVEDESGELWKVSYIPYRNGTEVIITLYNNHTKTIYDDTVENIALK